MTHLLPVMGKKLLVDIEARDVARYQKARLAEGASGRTVNIEVSMLRQIMRKYGAESSLTLRCFPNGKMLAARSPPKRNGLCLTNADSPEAACSCPSSCWPWKRAHGSTLCAPCSGPTSTLQIAASSLAKTRRHQNRAHGSAKPPCSRNPQVLGASIPQPTARALRLPPGKVQSGGHGRELWSLRGGCL